MPEPTARLQVGEYVVLKRGHSPAVWRVVGIVPDGLPSRPGDRVYEIRSDRRIRDGGVRTACGDDLRRVLV